MTFQCKACGAILEAEEGAKSVTCSYCGTTQDPQSVLDAATSDTAQDLKTYPGQKHTNRTRPCFGVRFGSCRIKTGFRQRSILTVCSTQSPKTQEPIWASSSPNVR